MILDQECGRPVFSVIKVSYQVAVKKYHFFVDAPRCAPTHGADTRVHHKKNI